MLISHGVPPLGGVR